MATFEERIESITQIVISETGTVHIQSEITQYLNDGIKDVTNKISTLRPVEAFKFTAEETDSTGAGISVKGRLLSVIRENGSAADVRPATPIPDGLRYLATDVNSLHYRSAYNPCYYSLNGKVYVLPAPSSSITRAIISHLDYKLATYNESSIVNFPDEYEDLVMLYGAAKACQAAATDIQNNMPDVPMSPAVENFEEISDTVDLPDLPIYIPLDVSEYVSTTSIAVELSRDDLEKAEKRESLVSKNLEIFKQKTEAYQAEYEGELENFKNKLDSAQKDMDRKSQTVVSEYRSRIYKYQYEISQYSQELQEKFTKYRWFLEQYIGLMNEYNQNLSMAIGQRKSPKPQAPKAAKQERQQEQEGQGQDYGTEE